MQNCVLFGFKDYCINTETCLLTFRLPLAKKKKDTF